MAIDLLEIKRLDSLDSFKEFRSEFHFPKTKEGTDFLYFCGNSLGLQSKHTAGIVNEELTKWQNHGVEGHFEEPRPWLSYHKNFESTISKLVGAKENEVITMNGLTVNLNLLLLSFYNPTHSKYKILLERNAFPSDQYAVKSQIDLLYKKGGLPDIQAHNALQYLEPDEWGIYDTDYLLEQIKDPHVSLLLLNGVNYQTGQVFELQKIAKACEKNKVVLGIDLAHAIGNVPLDLHNWGVDFAVWCTYKYLNGGPGSVGGAYVHEAHCNNPNLPRLHGWWSNKEENRFEMKNDVEPYQSAEAWQMSNAPVLSMAALLGSLQLFDQVDLEKYYQKGIALSDCLAQLIKEQLPNVKIITPIEYKGCQLSIFIEGKEKSFVEDLNKAGVIADWRSHSKGGILRVAPVPLYNSFHDCWSLVQVLKNMI